MIEQNPEKKNIIIKNIKFLILVVILSLIAWFGVKMLVSPGTASTSKKSSSLIQTGFGGGGTPPAGFDGGGGGTRPSGGFGG